MKFPLLWPPRLSMGTVVLAAALSVSACAKESDQPVSLIGELNEESVAYVTSRLKPGGTLIVESRGGYNAAALDLAEFILDHDITVEFTGDCLSACALFLLPAATSNSVYQPDALFGYHGNPIMLNFLYKGHDPQDRETCHQDLAERMGDLYARTGHNQDFWYLDMLVLGPTNITFEENGSRCGKIKYDQASRMWFPTATQLRENLGAIIGSQTCNSNRQCVMDRVKSWQQPEFTYTIGSARVKLSGVDE